MAEHLGYEKSDPGGRGSGNNRNGTTSKNVLTDIGAVEVSTPRDRNGSFEPKIVPKHARPPAGFNEQILSLYARGMSVRDIRSHLQQMYGVELSGGDVISRGTDAVTEEITIWQNLNVVRRRSAVEDILAGGGRHRGDLHGGRGPA